MKKIFAFLLIFCLSFALISCTAKTPEKAEEEVKLTPAEIAEKLVNGLEFGDILEQTDNEITFSKYGIDGSIITDAARYAGSGATADEVAVFECVDEDAVTTVMAAIDARQSYLSESYASYGPDEVPKIENAVVICDNLTVIFCIAVNSEAAEGIING